MTPYKTWLKQGKYKYTGKKWGSAPTVVIVDINKDQVTWRWEDETLLRYMTVNMAEMNLKEGYSHSPL